MTFPDVVGLVGVGVVLTAYFLLQTNRLSLKDYKFSLLNALGSLLILVSLFFNFNIASFVIEVAWIGISIFGIIKAVKEAG